MCIEVSKGDSSLQIIGDGYVSEDVLKAIEWISVRDIYCRFHYTTGRSFCVCFVHFNKNNDYIVM